MKNEHFRGHVAWTAAQVAALPVTVDLVTAGSLFGVGRTTAHELARAGSFPVPVLRVGSRYVVPSLAIKRLLIGDGHGLEELP